MGSPALREGLLSVSIRQDEEVSGKSGRKEYLSVDDMLTNYVGEFGRAQFWHFCAVSLAWTVEALYTLVMIFAERVPEWRCVSGVGEDVCSTSSSICNVDPSVWEWIDGKAATTVSEWGLICGEAYKVGFAGSIFFIGCLVGAGIYGSLSDSFLGRKGVLSVATTFTVLTGFLTSLSPNYWIYVLLRFLTGLNCGGVGLSSFVLATEPVGPTKRGPVGMSAFYFFSSGIMLLPLFAYFATSWRMLYAAISAPSVLYCIAVLPFLQESPRWYLVKGRLDDAMKTLSLFAKQNNNHIPSYVLLARDNMDAECRSGEGKEQPSVEELPADVIIEARASSNISANNATIMDLFRYSETRTRMLIMICIWFFTAVVYYGIGLNVVNLGFNLYIGVFVNGLIEMPSFLLTAILLGRIGRKSMLVTAMCLSGSCCFLGSFLFSNAAPPEGNMGTSQGYSAVSEKASISNFMGFLRLICGVMGIFGMAGTYNLVYIYTMELFPTTVRNAALGLTTQAAGTGSIIAPFIVVLGRLAPRLPFLIFGTVACAGASLAVWLPETLNQPLWETMDGMEKGENAKKLEDNRLGRDEENLDQLESN